MSESKHTPLSWVVDPSADCPIDGWTAIVEAHDDGNDVVAYAHPSNAEAIERLCSERDEVLDLLAIAHEVWMNSAPLHRTGERIQVKTILRKHGRIA